MIDTNWKPIIDEFQHWRDANMILPIWWRDDDAIKPTAALETLMAISVDFSMPVHLAIIPKYATPALVARITDTDLIIPTVHGWSHQSHAKAGNKNAEFGSDRPLADCISDVTVGIERMSSLFGNRLKPMFVPPWNRINPDLASHLVAAGYESLSTYMPRKSAHAASGLFQINTHIDPIAWRDDRGLIPTNILVSHTTKLLRDRRLGYADNQEPLGLLTHHLVHNDAIWDFVKQFLSVMLSGPISTETL